MSCPGAFERHRVQARRFAALVCSICHLAPRQSAYPGSVIPTCPLAFDDCRRPASPCSRRRYRVDKIGAILASGFGYNDFVIYRRRG